MPTSTFSRLLAHTVEHRSPTLSLPLSLSLFHSLESTSRENPVQVVVFLVIRVRNLHYAPHSQWYGLMGLGQARAIFVVLSTSIILSGITNNGVKQFVRAFTSKKVTCNSLPKYVYFLSLAKTHDSY